MRLDTCLAELDGIAIDTQPQRVKRRSRDFYWYSPVLKRALDSVCADAVVTPKSEDEVVAVLAAAWRNDVPITPRGAGTGNYGQAMPLKAGIVLDLSELNAVLDVGPGRVTAQAGSKLVELEALTRARSGQELRFHPSTLRTATIGGFIAGGSSGVGSITWGLLRDRGNILMTRVVTLEEQPRILELRGADIQKVNHAYGTNGVLTVVEMPLAPAYRWAERVFAFEDFEAALHFADRLAHEDGILKKLVTPIAAPVPHQYLFPDLVGAGESVVLILVAEHALGALDEFAREHPTRVASAGFQDERRPAEEMLFEHAWNHTTLHALKHDRTLTYLQTLFPPPNHVELALAMYREFGDEVPMHLEFVRFAGQIACFGLQLVRYTTDERLFEIIDRYNERGCPIFNPHDFTLEGGGMKRVDERQLAFKREADPKGLLNPGKMIGWENPSFDESHDRRFLYESP